MNKTIRLGSAVVVLGLLPLGGLAQAQQLGDQRSGAGAQASGGLLMAEKICGQAVKNLQAEQIGTLQHLLISSHGQIKFAVIDVAEASGSTGRQVAVPWSLLRMSNKGLAGTGQPQIALTLDADKERLKIAPSFEKDRLDQLDDPATMRRVQTFWRTQREAPIAAPTGLRVVD